MRLLGSPNKAILPQTSNIKNLATFVPVATRFLFKAALLLRNRTSKVIVIHYNMLGLELQLNLKEFITAFMVLFAVIDITGSIPIIATLNNQGKHVHAGKAALISLGILIVFLFAGNAMLKLFNTDIASFAVAGSLVLFALALEMILNIEIFRNDGPKGFATIVPVVFPLIAGAGTLTTTLSLRSQYHESNIIAAILINMGIVYLVLKNIHLVEKFLGESGIYILRKIFGIILLSMSVKLFFSNLNILLHI